MTDDNDDTGNGSGSPKVEFTAEQHAEINRIVAARTAEAARKAADARQADIDAYLAAEKAKTDRAAMDEADRLRAETAEATARAEAAEAVAAATTAKATATTALLAAGFAAGTLDDALRLIDPASADLPGDIKALAERLPALLATPAGQPSQAAAGATQHRRTTTGSGGTREDRAKARFTPRYGTPAA